jgi:membrane protein DedA with SNARE-associated domain
MLDWLRSTLSATVEFLATWTTVFCVWLAETVLALGYPGIVFLMAVESSLVPFPSEIVMPPAGYLIHKGEMGWFLVILSGVAGSMLGALFNYYLAYYFGRPFFLKFGKYFFLNQSHLEKAERFFASHGEITTFVGRLIPVVRQLISLPAGVSRMPVGKFCLFTALGAGIWVSVLTAVGWVVGRNADLLHSTLRNATLWALAFALALVVGYVKIFAKRKTPE